MAEEINLYRPPDQERIPKEMFEAAGLEYNEKIKNFIDLLPTKKETKENWAYSVSTIFSSMLLVDRLERHANALVKAADASERHARSLTYATWALVIATIMLGCVAVLTLLFQIAGILLTSQYGLHYVPRPN